MKRALITLAFAVATPAAAAACASYTVSTSQIGEVPVVEVARNKLPAAHLMGYMTARPVVNVDEARCTLALSYDTTAIYLARDVAASECTRDHILAHEREHHAIYNRELAKADGSKVQSAEVLLAGIRAAQAAHDSPEEYETNNHVCGGAMPRLLRARR